MKNRISLMMMPLLMALATPLLISCGGDDDENGGGKSASVDFVDLGLSVKWATCNLGAKSSYGLGNYYAWSETTTKERFTKGTYTGIYYDDPKYYPLETLTSDLDAATANLGVPCRMPTEDEMEELIQKCEWSWAKYYDDKEDVTVAGYKVTGPNGNTIFLPSAGIRADSLTSNTSEGFYMTSSVGSNVNSSGDTHFYFIPTILHFTASKYAIDSWYYESLFGFSVRPVRPYDANE